MSPAHTQVHVGVIRRMTSRTRTIEFPVVKYQHGDRFCWSGIRVFAVAPWNKLIILYRELFTKEKESLIWRTHACDPGYQRLNRLWSFHQIRYVTEISRSSELLRGVTTQKTEEFMSTSAEAYDHVSAWECFFFFLQKFAERAWIWSKSVQLQSRLYFPHFCTDSGEIWCRSCLLDAVW